MQQSTATFSQSPDATACQSLQALLSDYVRVRRRVASFGDIELLETMAQRNTEVLVEKKVDFSACKNSSDLARPATENYLVGLRVGFDKKNQPKTTPSNQPFPPCSTSSREDTENGDDAASIREALAFLDTPLEVTSEHDDPTYDALCADATPASEAELRATAYRPGHHVKYDVRLAKMILKGRVNEHDACLAVRQACPLADASTVADFWHWAGSLGVDKGELDYALYSLHRRTQRKDLPKIVMPLAWLREVITGQRKERVRQGMGLFPESWQGYGFVT
jgi:hypothetical protein